MEAFNLIMRNLVRVVVLDSVVDFLLFLGKLVIVLITGAASYLAFSGNIPDIKVIDIYLKIQFHFPIFIISRRRFPRSTTTTLQSCSLLLVVTSSPAPSSESTPWQWTRSSSASWRTWRGTTGARRSRTTCPRT